jgi:hypothetical protein
MQAYKIMARNTRTGFRIQRQDLSGYLITRLAEANEQAELLARAQTARTREPWTAEVSVFTVGVNRPAQ